MSCRYKRLNTINFPHVSQYFSLPRSSVGQNRACKAFYRMTRRRISSMPAGLVIAALAVIALVAIAALFLLGGPADSALGNNSPGNPALTGKPEAQ